MQQHAGPFHLDQCRIRSAPLPAWLASRIPLLRLARLLMPDRLHEGAACELDQCLVASLAVKDELSRLGDVLALGAAAAAWP